MELKGLQADEPIVKTQNAKTTSQTPKTKTKTTNTVPNNTLQKNQCQFCKEEGHIEKKCPKHAKRQKMDKDQGAPRCPQCNTLGHEKNICYFGANMESRPPKWALTEN